MYFVQACPQGLPRIQNGEDDNLANNRLHDLKIIQQEPSVIWYFQGSSLHCYCQYGECTLGIRIAVYFKFYLSIFLVSSVNNYTFTMITSYSSQKTNTLQKDLGLYVQHHGFSRAGMVTCLAFLSHQGQSINTVGTYDNNISASYNKQFKFQQKIKVN